jgi:hypothetical protein
MLKAEKFALCYEIRSKTHKYITSKKFRISVVKPSGTCMNY